MLTNRLKELRKEKGLKQEDISKIIGISTSAYGYYEQGKTSPDPETLKCLADFYNVSVDYLLGRTNTKKIQVDDDLSEEAKAELESFKEYLKLKYGKKGQD